MNQLNRYLGALLGLACGDALGTTLEFQKPGTFQPMLDMVGEGPFHLQPGEWTDDTSLALCLAESLIMRAGFDPIDQLERYVRWHQEGYLSSNGRCYDIGNTTKAALELFIQTHQEFCGSTVREIAGNGSLMRLAPVPMFFAQCFDEAVYFSGQSSRTTHGAPEAIDACRYYGGLIAGALNGESKEVLLLNKYEPITRFWDDHPLEPAIEAVAKGSFRSLEPPAIQSSGYVVKSLEAALWAFYNSRNFEEGCLLAVNLGDDADTVGAIYGQLAGAYYGIIGIPEKWRSKLAFSGTICSFAEQIYQLAKEK